MKGQITPTKAIQIAKVAKVLYDRAAQTRAILGIDLDPQMGKITIQLSSNGRGHEFFEALDPGYKVQPGKDRDNYYEVIACLEGVRIMAYYSRTELVANFPQREGHQ